MSSTIYVTWVILGSQINCQFGREVAEHGETDHLVMIDTFWEGEKKKDRGREREREREREKVDSFVDWHKCYKCSA